MDPITDLITAQGITGNVAQRLIANGMDVGALRPWTARDGRSYVTLSDKTNRLVANSLLRKDEWKAMDDMVLPIARDRMVGMNDLISRGLTYNITNGLGTTVLEYEDMSDMSAAEMDMTAVKRSAGDAVAYSINYLPLPIIHKDFQINIRKLEASRKVGQPLDVTQAAIAATKCAEYAETLLFKGTGGITYGGGTIYGYENHPSTGSSTLTAAWTASAATGETIVEDVIAMKQVLITALHYGPYMLYVPTNYETALDKEYSTSSWSGGKTIRERIKQIAGIEDVKVADKMTASKVLLVEMAQETARVVVGLQPTTVEWTTEGGMVSHFKIMQITVPQIRADQDGNCGVVLGAAA